MFQWINSDARQFKPFVARRVAEIREDSDPSCWRWVPTANNVADDATRGVGMSNLCNGRWKCGPEFLVLPHESWPVVPVATDDPDMTELKKEFVATISTPPAVTALPDAT